MTQIVFKKNLNPKLSTKGKILVAIPLTVQIISVAVMSFMIWTSEQESARLDRSRDIASEALLIAKLVYDTEYHLYEYIEIVKGFQLAPPRLEQQYEYGKLQIREHLSKLWILARERPNEEKAIVREFIRHTKSLLTLLDRIKDSLKQRDLKSVFSLGLIMSESNKYLPRLSSLIAQLSEIEERDMEANKAKEIRAATSWILFASVGLNIIVVLSLLAQFNKGTIARLAVLMDNTKRLASQQTLNPRLEGSDEIGELDRVFHEAADAMDAAKKREKELAELKQQVLAMVSHDLRSPLTSLKLTLDMLQHDMLGKLPDEAHDRVVQSEQSVARLIRMINDLLDVEKLEAGMMEVELRDVPLEVIICRSVEAVDELARSKGLRIVHDETEHEVRADGDRLIQVLVNFLSNAIKFSPEGADICISTTKRENMVELRVTDKGPGIPEDARLKIFERYRQVKGEKSKGGTGLGLAISKLVIEMHGGHIGVDPVEGGGSSFWCTIPAAAEFSEDEGDHP